MKLALIFLVCACSPVYLPATCRTACGMALVSEIPMRPSDWPVDAPDWSCTALQAVEDGVLQAFPKADDDRFKHACEVLSSWTVEIKKVEVFEYHDTPVVGLTECGMQLSTISNLPPDRSSLPHELAHAVQGCLSNSCAHPGQDPMHACWVENHIYIAAANANLEAARLLKDGGP